MTTAAEVVARVPISAVWRALGGGPLRYGRGQAFWRESADGYNVSLSDIKGVWHDFAGNVGGGVLDLVQHVQGGTRAEALKFVADVGGVTIASMPLSRTEKRVYAEHRQQGALLAQQCAWWTQARMRRLEVTKADAVERRDVNALAWSSRELYLMQWAIPAALMDRFLTAMKADLEGTASFVEAGRNDELNVHLVTAAIVMTLTQAQVNAEEADHGA